METMTKPKIGDLKVIVKDWGKEFAVEVSVYKQNTLRGDAYWVSKVFRTFKKKADADKFASRFS